MRFSSFQKSILLFLTVVVVSYVIVTPFYCAQILGVLKGSGPALEVEKYPGFQQRKGLFADPDGAKWVSILDDGIRKGTWRVGKSPVDADRVGTEPTMVYWSSGFYLMMRLGVGVAGLVGFTGTEKLELGGMLAQPLILFFGIPLLVFLSFRIFKPPYSWGFVPVLLAGTSFVSTFIFTRPDHHGLIMFFNVLWVFLFFDPSRRARILSGIALGFSLWISTLTTVPILGLFGLGALAAAAQKTPFCPSMEWRKWGWTAALTGFLLWLLDFYPDRIGMRLEVLHPLWCLSVAGGAELLLRFSAILQKEPSPGFGVFSPFLGWFTGIIFLIAPPFAMLYSAGGWFWPSYPWVKDLMYSISELQAAPIATVLGAFIFLPIILGVLLGINWKRGKYVGLALFGVLLVCLPLFQVRWLAFAGSFATLVVFFAVNALSGRDEKRWGSIFAGLLFFQLLLTSSSLWAESFRVIKLADTFGMEESYGRMKQYRKLANTLLEDSKGKRFVVLGPPDVCTWLSYFGGGKGVSSIYWEAWRGLRDTAEVLAAEKDEDALDILAGYKVDYVVLYQDSHAKLFRRTENGQQKLEEKEMFSTRILGDKVPAWLVKVPWENPPGAERIAVFRIDWTKVPSVSPAVGKP